jgi:8-oxo-dGTP diphosphatase
MKLATLCYVRQDGHTLMVHRVKKKQDMHAGKWNGLGGKLEPGETPEECAIREIREESGLKVKNLILKGIITFPAFDDNEDWYTFLFVIDDFEGELIDSPEGHLAWIPNEELQNLKLWAGDLIFLPWIEQDRFFSGKFVYQDKILVKHEVIFYG